MIELPGAAIFHAVAAAADPIEVGYWFDRETGHLMVTQDLAVAAGCVLWIVMVVLGLVTAKNVLP